MFPQMIIDTHMEQAIYYEVRATHDVAIWQRDWYVRQDGSANWLIVQVKPAAQSGSATIPGGYINAETGELKVPPGAQTSIVKSGSWRWVDGPVQVIADEYHWFEPMEEGKRRIEPEDIYSPFVHGGTLLFSLAKGAKGIEQFGAPILLFEEWAAAASQAISMYLPTEASMAEPTSQLRSELQKARGSGNPLVATWAWRHSLTLDPDGTQIDLNIVSGHALAVRTRLLLDVGGEASAREVMQAVSSTNDLSRLEAMALGAFSAAELPSAGRGASAREVLATIAAKAHNLDAGGEAKPRLRAILTLAGFADNKLKDLGGTPIDD